MDSWRWIEENGVKGHGGDPARSWTPVGECVSPEGTPVLLQDQTLAVREFGLFSGRALNYRTYDCIERMGLRLLMHDVRLPYGSVFYFWGGWWW